MLDAAYSWFGIAGHRLVDRAFYHRMILTPLRPIVDHDTLGGHITSRHIGKTISYLRNRLTTQPTRAQVSSFWDEPTARACINYVISDKLADILTWLATPTGDNRLGLSSRPPVITWVGLGLRRPNMDVVFLKGVRVILHRISPTDFHVLTAWPE